jgi:3-hydroxyisobutyrate dehydrogenase
MKTPQRIGFIGLGNMGYPMAGRLAEAGFNLTVFDLDSNVQDRFIADHESARAVDPAEVGLKSDLVITMLPDDKVVQAVVLGADDKTGLAETMAPEAIIVDMSSSAPMATCNLGRILAARQIHLIDAPVSGGVSKARNGTLAIMAGGDPEVIALCRPVLSAMGERIFPSGPLGSGHAVKALNNMLSAAGFIAAVEVLLVGQRFGVNPGVMNEIFNASTGRNNSTEKKMKQHVLSRSFSSGFSLDLMVKDLNTAMDLAAELEVPAIFSNVCKELWSAAQSALGKGHDHTEVARWFEELVRDRLVD